jgi:hypothetical protein
MPDIRSQIGTYYQTGEKPALHHIYVYALRPQLPEAEQISVFIDRQQDPIIPDADYIRALPARIPTMTLRGHSIDSVPWLKPSYQVYLMYHTDYRFVKDRGVTFTYDHPPFGNHVFWDGEDFVGNDGNIIAVACRNLRVNHRGEPLGERTPESERFAVDFNTDPPLPVHPRPRMHDETGTNTGP